MKYVLLIVLLFFNSIAYSQPQKIKIKGLMMVIKDTDGEYLYSKAWVETDYLGVMDFDKSKINLYIPNEFDIDIVKTGTPIKDTHNNSVLKLTGIDNTAEKCTVGLITLDKMEEGYRFFLKIEYADVILVYRYVYE